MIKKDIGSFDPATGTFTPAPKQSYTQYLQFQLGAHTPPAPAPAPVPVPSPNGHLHYGGQPLAGVGINGIGLKPSNGVTFRHQKRLEMIVRLENAGIPEHAMAPMLQITVTRLRSIRKTVEYLKARNKITLGIIVDHDASMTQIKEQRKEVLAQHLPAALQVIANIVNQPTALLDSSNKKLQVAVAQDLLDREGTFAKVSRSELKVEERKFDWNALDKSHGSIVDVIRGAASTRITPFELQDTINLSKDFSNSATISVVDQQASLDTLEKQALAEALASGRQDA